jgi:hypothetical protein
MREPECRRISSPQERLATSQLRKIRSGNHPPHRSRSENDAVPQTATLDLCTSQDAAASMHIHRPSFCAIHWHWFFADAGYHGEIEPAAVIENRRRRLCSLVLAASERARALETFRRNPERKRSGFTSFRERLEYRSVSQRREGRSRPRRLGMPWAIANISPVKRHAQGRASTQSPGKAIIAVVLTQ